MYKLVYEDLNNPNDIIEVLEKNFDKKEILEKKDIELIKVVDLSKNITIYDAYKGIYAF